MASTAVRDLRADFRAALRRRHEVRRAFTLTMRRALRQHRAAVIASLKREPSQAGAAAAANLDARVLTIIERHPEGVRALDVGNELGLDWRRVLAATRNLVAVGLVERVDQEFYAARKAGQTW